MSNTTSSPRAASTWSRLLTAFVVVGCVLRVVQWGAGTSLWHDEFLLARSVLDFGLAEIATSGLQDNQVAPLTFVALTKGAVALFGEGERALRLVPFLVSLAALFAFAHLARSVLRPRGAAVAVAAFALNPLLVSLAGAVKQYSTDALVAVLILLAFRSIVSTGALGASGTAVASSDPPGAVRRRRLAVAVGAGLLGFLSIPSVLIAGPAAAVVCVLGLRASNSRDAVERRSLVVAGVAWGVIAGLAALQAQAAVPPETRAYMFAFWTRWGVFMPPILEYPTWLIDVARDRMVPGLLIRSYMDNRAPDAVSLAVTGFAAAAALIGLIRLVVARGLAWVAVVSLPVVASLVVARLALYPPVPRTSIHLLIPLLLVIGAAFGVQASRRTTPTASSPTSRRGAHQVPPPTSLRVERLRDAFAGLVLVAILGGGFVGGGPPFTVQPVRETLGELAALRALDEPVVVHLDAEPALNWYGPSLGLSGVVVPTSGGVPALLESLDRFRGRAGVWVVFANQEGDRDAVLCALDVVGVETDRRVLFGVRKRTPISIHRFDLSGARAPIVPFVGDCPPRSYGPTSFPTSVSNGTVALHPSSRSTRDLP